MRGGYPLHSDHVLPLVGYARCSTDSQGLTAQRQRLVELGVARDRIYLDHGLTGTTRKRPGLDQALVAVRASDTLVVPKLGRLARSVPDARAIGDDLAARAASSHSAGRSTIRPTRWEDVLQHPRHARSLRATNGCHRPHRRRRLPRHTAHAIESRQLARGDSLP
ncbi:MAG: recombinase family protein [Pseudonocardiaceae bacterium]